MGKSFSTVVNIFTDSSLSQMLRNTKTILLRRNEDDDVAAVSITEFETRRECEVKITLLLCWLYSETCAFFLF